MGTPLQTVYDAFLAKMLDDEFYTAEGLNEDLYQLLAGARSYFKFPRVSLDIEAVESQEINIVDGNEVTETVTSQQFVGDLGNDEIQILSTYMKCEWLNREILTWERIKPLYEERDFSEANMLSKLYDALEIERKRGLKLESIYYRSINYNPWDYTKLSGDPS